VNFRQLRYVRPLFRRFTFKRIIINNCWLKVKNWLTFTGPLSKPEPEEASKVKIKCPEIEVLDHYDKDPGEKFWSKFPKREYPSKIHTDINTTNLAKLLQERSPLLTTAERLRGARTLDFLTNGASAHQKSPLPCSETRKVHDRQCGKLGEIWIRRRSVRHTTLQQT
jgi:hypothetical protein